MEKTLDKLADEYVEAVKYHDHLIKKYREKLKDAIKKCAPQDDVIHLKTMICEFYRQRADMVETIYKLKNYYKFSSRKEEAN